MISFLLGLTIGWLVRHPQIKTLRAKYRFYRKNYYQQKSELFNYINKQNYIKPNVNK